MYILRHRMSIADPATSSRRLNVALAAFRSPIATALADFGK
jgi:hypothetical protein